MAERTPIVLSRSRAPTTGQEAFERQLVQWLMTLPGSDVTVVPHLYDLPAEGATLRWLRTVPGDLVVLSWLYPRSTFWLLDANGVRGRFGRTSSWGEEEPDDAMTRSHQRTPAPDRTIWCFDLRTYEHPGAFVGEIARLMGQDGAGPWDDAAVPIEGKTGDVREIAEAARERWYPVIDFGRCNDCLECLNFCLFGVFGLDEADQPWVEQPDACRPGCPACARICPNRAIMFPQHTDPAIAGDPRASREGLKLDLSQLFRGLTPAELAAAERARALADQPGDAAPPRPPSPTDALDRLVDRVDDWEP